MPRVGDLSVARTQLERGRVRWDLCVGDGVAQSVTLPMERADMPLEEATRMLLLAAISSSVPPAVV